MSESLLSRAAVSEPSAAPTAETAPSAFVDAPRGIALRRTAPRRVLADAADSPGAEDGVVLAQLAADRATPAPRIGGWRSWLGGAR